MLRARTWAEHHMFVGVVGWGVTGVHPIASDGGPPLSLSVPLGHGHMTRPLPLRGRDQKVRRGPATLPPPPLCPPSHNLHCNCNLSSQAGECWVLLALRTLFFFLPPEGQPCSPGGMFARRMPGALPLY